MKSKNANEDNSSIPLDGPFLLHPFNESMYPHLVASPLFYLAMKARSIKGNTPEEIRSALSQTLADGYKPTLAIAFISIKQDRNAICKMLHKEGIEVFGATSCGEFINGHQSEGASAILLLDVNPDHYSILFEDMGDRSLPDITTALAKKALQKFQRPAFILCTTALFETGELLDGDLVVRSIEAVVGPQVTICGGMAGDDWTLTGSYIFTHDHETKKGIAALVFDEDYISVQGMAISGWKPIGISRTITRCNGSSIYTIDDKPALEMYLKYLGETHDEGKGKYSFFEEVAVHFPFLVERDSGSALMVTPMSVDKTENALICDVAVKQGSKLHFTMPPELDFVDQVLEQASDLKKTVPDDAEALLIFSCAGRVSALGPLATLENEGLAELWKAPMAGFFTYGEFGRARNERQEFHSTTNSWVVLCEKD